MKKLVAIFCGMLCMYSCQEQSVLEENTISNETIMMQESRSISDSSFVTKQLATQVAESLINTKARSAQGIADVITLSNEAGEPVIYVVNYTNDGGYAMISATQNYYPVLMKADFGRFDAAAMPEAANWYIDTYKLNIDHLRNAPLDSVSQYRQEWAKYNSSGQTRSRSVNDLPVNVLRFMQDSEAEWMNNNYQFAPIATNSFNLPDDIYHQALITAEMGLREDFMQTSYIVRNEEVNTIYVDKMLSTTWDQITPYNAAVKRELGDEYPTGCAITAMAQIMKYHGKPSRYNWSSMPQILEPNDNPNWDIAELMLDLGIAADIIYTLTGSQPEGGVNDIVTAFREFGYSNARKVSHNEFTTRQQILSYNPVWMAGESESGKGHAWVCDGINENNFRTAYYVMTLTEYSDGTLSYIQHELMSENEHASRTFHMNWGYNGDGDGWFRDDNIQFELYPGESYRNYNRKRTDIIDIE